MHKLDRTLLLITLLPIIVVATSLIFFHSMIAAFVTYHLFICLLLPAVYLKTHRQKKESLSAILGLSLGKHKQSILTGILLGLVSFTVMLFFFTSLQNILFSKAHITSLLSSWGYNKVYFLPLALYFIFFNAVVEEIFWRGFLYTYYKKAWGSSMASIIIALCFIQYHFVTIWLLFSLQAALALVVVLFVVNLLWNYLRERFGNIYASILWHLFADLAIMWVYYFFIYS